jgi:hypothetical protein
VQYQTRATTHASPYDVAWYFTPCREAAFAESECHGGEGDPIPYLAPVYI